MEVQIDESSALPK